MSLIVTDIPTAVIHVEQEKLAELATGRTVLELGSDYGGSTVLMARVARLVHAVDDFAHRGPGGQLPDFVANLERYGVRDRVIVHCGSFDDVVPFLRRKFDFAFLDGEHNYEDTLDQIALARSVLKPGSLIAVHDYEPQTFAGVVRAVNKLGKPQVVATLAWLAI